MPFVQPKEEWIPVSDWGRMMKPYLDQVNRDALIVIRNPKPRVAQGERPKRIRVRKPKPSTGNPPGRPKNLAFTSDRKCSACETYIRSDNKAGLCQKHAKKAWNIANRQAKRAA